MNLNYDYKICGANLQKVKYTQLRLTVLFLFLLIKPNFAQENLQLFQNKIDSLVENAMDSLAFPGAQVLIIHKNKNLIHKAYGFHTYDKFIAVDTTHLFDLASVTKIMAGGMALMKLQEHQLFSPDQTLSETHPYFRNSNKADITWRSILAHQSRMQSYIVMWQKMKKKNGHFKWRTFSSKQGKNYPYTIDNDIKLHKRYPKLMHKIIKKSDLLPETKYLYSGTGFLLIPELVKQKSGLTLDQLLKREYYDPMKLTRIGFQPYKYFPAAEIVPTEIDTFFRKKLVHTFVHDENAAMLDGVSANAGLFSNAADLGKISQMLLDDGMYNGHQYLPNSIIKEYNTVQFPENDNRRGLVFDKPLLQYNDKDSYIAKSASPISFGHGGFTGTFMWLDPEYDLIVIFLSNRVYPYRSSRALYSLNFRAKLHQFAYDYINSLNN